MTLLEEAQFLTWLAQECGYTHIRPLGNGHYVAIKPFLYTAAIVKGRVGDNTGYDDRWCYYTTRSAIAALEKWDGTDEPLGWHRHPGSGRRRSEDGTEHINW